MESVRNSEPEPVCAYAPPEVTVLGTFHDLTLKKTSSPQDNDGHHS